MSRYTIRTDDDAATLDPNGYLAAGDIEEIAESIDTDRPDWTDLVAQINDAIAEWAERDPNGYSEPEARALDAQITRILG